MLGKADSASRGDRVKLVAEDDVVARIFGFLDS
jgi:hypothetical protein